MNPADLLDYALDRLDGPRRERIKRVLAHDPSLAGRSCPPRPEPRPAPGRRPGAPPSEGGAGPAAVARLADSPRPGRAGSTQELGRSPIVGFALSVCPTGADDRPRIVYLLPNRVPSS